jgi:hypothetical protein
MVDVSMLLRVRVWGVLVGWLEVIPLVGHVGCMKEARSHSLRFLDRLRVASSCHLLTKDKDLLDRTSLGLFFLLSTPFFLISLRVKVCLWFYHLIILIIKAVFETVDFFLEFLSPDIRSIRVVLLGIFEIWGRDLPGFRLCRLILLVCSRNTVELVVIRGYVLA